MHWTIGMENAVTYIETHLTETIDYEQVAAQSYSSSYHFQRVFGIWCGITLGEYIRRRRLSLAGAALASGRIKVVDAALKYGYENPDSFARAFKKFHGVLPSQAKAGAPLKSFPRLQISDGTKGELPMDYKIEKKPKMILTGYKAHFTGVPFGEARARQEERLFRTTRAKQWLLRGAMSASADAGTDMCLIANVCDAGYDFYYAAALAPYERENLYCPEVTGVTCMASFGFEQITVPAQTYAVFRTECQPHPTDDYMDIRQRIATEWLSATQLELVDAPEISVYHWYPKAERDARFIEIWLPIAAR